MFFGDEIQAVERLTGGTVKDFYYDPLKMVYGVKFEKDNRIEYKKISKRLVEEEVKKIKKLNISLDGLGEG